MFRKRIREASCYCTIPAHVFPVHILREAYFCEGSMYRESEPESRAMTRRTLNAHLSLLSANELLTNVETQAQPHFPATLDRRLRNLVKPLPDLLLLVQRE